MNELIADKDTLASYFPPHVREACLQKYEQGQAETRARLGRTKPTRQKHEPDTDATYTTYRDRHADAIREDGEQKAEWTYQRQHGDQP